MGEFVMPSLGADMEAGTLVRWKHGPGDRLQKGDVIAEVETDKGLIEVEVFESGVIDRLLVEEGTKVPVGTPLAVLRGEQDAGVAPRTPAPAPQAAPPAPEAPRASPSARQEARERRVDLASVRGTGRHGTITRTDVVQAHVRGTAPREDTVSRIRISPYARRRAAALGLDPSRIEGSGPDGAITVRDIERSAAEAHDATGKRPAAAGAAPVDPRERMRTAIAAAMARSKREIPHYYLSTTIDLGPATAWIAEHNQGRPPAERILAGALFLKAVALALRDVPELNARWEGTGAPPLPDVHVGVAVSLRGGGLVAPAIHHTDRQPLLELMRALNDLVKRTRAGSLRSSEMADGTITWTSLGDRGVETVFPVIYPPQVAIVGFGKIVERPWVVDGAIVARPTVVATLAGDHRVSDGHRGALYLAAVQERLMHPETL